MASPWPIAFSMIGASGETGETGPQGPPGSGSASFTNIYSSNQFVSCGESMHYSPDGTTWNEASELSTEFLNGEGKCVAWNGSYWLAGGYNSDHSITMLKSTDGYAWSPVTNPLNYEVNGIAWNGSYWLAVGKNTNENVSIIKSSNGVTWTPTPSTNPPFGAGGGYGVANAVAWNGTQWLVLGYSSGATPISSTSTDGMTWTAPVVVGVSSCISTNGLLWVIGGDANSVTGSTIQTSSDGITWSTQSGFTGVCTSIAWNGSMFVGCGTTGAFPYIHTMSSPDGITWTDSTWSFANSQIPKSVAWNGVIWVVTCGSTYATSLDGLNWDAATEDVTLGIIGSQVLGIITQYVPSLTTRTLYLQSGTPGATAFQSTMSISITSTFTSTIMYTGAIETFTIPEGVSEITFDVIGGGGANLGGAAAYVSGTYTVQTGDSNIDIIVGQGGQIADSNATGASFSNSVMTLNTLSGGAAADPADTDPNSVGGGGGGASGILFPNGTDVIIVGAGAGGYSYGLSGFRGGDGGITNGSEPSYVGVDITAFTGPK